MMYKKTLFLYCLFLVLNDLSASSYFNFEEKFKNNTLISRCQLQVTGHSSDYIRTHSLKPTKDREQNTTKISLRAKPIDCEEEEKVLKRINLGQDARLQIKDTHQWPYSVHGVIAIRFPSMSTDEVCWGTGTLIGPYFVLTAAHNLYNRDEKETASSIRFLPAINGTMLPFREPKVLKFYFPESYKSNQGKTEDYGLIILDQPIADFTGHFGLSIHSPDRLKDKQVSIFGYPADKVHDKDSIYEMWGMSGPLIQVNKDWLSYEIDTFGGQSGSAVWYKDRENYYVVGVHATGSKDPTCGYNKGILLNKERYTQIINWIKESAYNRLKQEIYEDILELNLSEQYVHDGGAQQLARYPLTALQKLDLGWNGIGPKGAQVLFKAHWPYLKVLNLEGNALKDEGLQILLQANWPRLKNLNLQNTDITGKGLDFFLKITTANLSVLNLGGNSLDKEGIKIISRYFPHLVHLDLSNTCLGDDGIKSFSKNTYPKLQVLSLVGNNLHRKGIKFLSQVSFPSLQSVYLDQNSLEDKALIPLGQTFWPCLQLLGLSENKISKNGVGTLSQAPWTTLRVLDLSQNTFAEDALPLLSASPYWASLSTLDISGNSINLEKIKSFEREDLYIRF